MPHFQARLRPTWGRKARSPCTPRSSTVKAPPEFELPRSEGDAELWLDQIFLRLLKSALASPRARAALFIGVLGGVVVALTSGSLSDALIAVLASLSIAYAVLPRVPIASTRDYNSTRLHPRRLFASDTPVPDLSERDYFGHRAFSEALATAIVGAEPPFTIALTGPWGSGKTSIAHDHLARALDEKAHASGESIAFIYFDVWKYEDSLRRQLLREFALQLKQQGRLAKTFDVDRELEDLEYETAETRFGPPRIGRSGLFMFAIRAASVAAFLAVVLLTAVIALGYTSANQLPDAIQKSLLVVGAGAVISLARDFANAFQVKGRQITRKAADSADQFERRFADLIRLATVDRVVIVLDDLDRCEPETVVRMLNGIKAFLEPSFPRSGPTTARVPTAPIFVIPCDPDAIRNHLVTSRTSLSYDPDEYLRKFFNASIRITPSLDIEARTLVEKELDQLELANELDETEREGLISVVVSAFRRNPRRVKQFLNDVSLKRLVLVRREDGGEINPKISNQVAFLAKLTAIEQEWRDAYQAIEQDERAYDHYANLALGLRTSQFSGPLDERFGDFLRATRTVQSKTPGAFVRLKLTPDEVSVPLYYRFRESLLDGRIEDVRSVVAEMADPEAYVRVVRDLLRSEAQHRRLSTVLAIVDAILRVPELQNGRLATLTADTFESRPTLYDSLNSLTPARLLQFLVGGDPDRSKPFVTRLILFANTSHFLALNASDQGVWAGDLAQGLGSLKSVLSPDHIKLVREVGESAAKPFRDAFVPTLAESGASDLISDKAAAQLFVDLDPASLQVPDEHMIGKPPIRLWLASHTALGGQAIDAFVTRSTQLLVASASDPSGSWRSSLISLLYRGRTALSKVTDSACKELATQLVSQRQVFEAGRPRWESLSVLASLPCAAPADITAGVNQVIAADSVSALMTVTEDLLAGMPSDSLAAFGQGMVSRASSATPPDLESLLIQLIDLAPVIGWTYIGDALEASVATNQFEAVASVIEQRREILRKQEPSPIKAALVRLLQRTTQGSWPEWPRAYETVFRLAGDLDLDDKHNLITGLGTWISTGDTQSRQSGSATIQKGVAAGALSDEAESSIAKHILGTLEGRADPSWQPILEWMVQLIPDGASTEGQQLKRTLEKMGDQPAWRVLSADLLGGVRWPGSSALPVVSKLLAWSRDANEAADGPILRAAVSIGEKDKRTAAYKAVASHLQSFTN